VGSASKGQLAADFVLSPFSATQKTGMTQASHTAADRVLALVREGA
jgi:peptidyl-tRNA hydrolase